jgi:hypothetical protein
MGAVSISETSVNYQTARGNIPEDSHLCTGRRGNLKSHELWKVYPWSRERVSMRRDGAFAPVVVPTLSIERDVCRPAGCGATRLCTCCYFYQLRPDQAPSASPKLAITLRPLWADQRKFIMLFGGNMSQGERRLAVFATSSYHFAFERPRFVFLAGFLTFYSTSDKYELETW